MGEDAFLQPFHVSVLPCYFYSIKLFSHDSSFYLFEEDLAHAAYNVHTTKFVKQERSKGEADAEMKQGYQSF